MFINTPTHNSFYPAGLGIDGEYDDRNSIINLKAFGVKYLGWYSSLALHTSDGTSINEAMRIDRYGNIGIGTTAPSCRLEVEQSSAGDNTEYLLGAFNHSGNGGGVYVGYVGDGLDAKQARIRSGGNLDLAIGTTSNREVLNITDLNGNVGIGTSNPISRLEVNGDISLARTHKIKFLENVNGGDRAYIRSTNGEGGDYNSMIFAIGTGNESMIIKNDGNIGIGTTTPDDKLTVKGRIRAEEVKVDLSVPGPDYVFKEGYDLKSLEEVQHYIKEKGHLPNIPSAAEMEENGVELGLMNMKLLEKIEELTLYQLQLLQQLETSHTEIEKLKKRVEHLEGK